MKLIDKDALVAEIERLKNHYDSAAKEFGDEGYTDNVLMEQCKATVCGRVLSFINTLKVKEMELDKEIKKVQRKYKTIEEYEGYPCTMYANNIEWIAKHFFELGMSISNKAQKGE